ncbi:MAG: hypothetical protein A4E69_01654 [Syntrophus sp. PtaB.Bin138]|nr:MAG: hypothetical protein A4E69_01654 [Syntrophus sp. PtaB.Bin138]
MAVVFRLPYMSIWAAPRMAMTRFPVILFCMVAKASISPPVEFAPHMTRESDTAQGRSSRRASTAPDSKKITLSGAEMFFAAMAASMEMPVPQNTMSPLWISLAAMIVMISGEVPFMAPHRGHTTAGWWRSPESGPPLFPPAFSGRPVPGILRDCSRRR